MALLRVLVVDLSYAFENHAGRQPWDGRDPKWTVYDRCGPLRYSVICVLGCHAQKWARITRNKTVRALRPKTDNIWQVGPGVTPFQILQGLYFPFVILEITLYLLG